MVCFPREEKRREDTAAMNDHGMTRLTTATTHLFPLFLHRTSGSVATGGAADVGKGKGVSSSSSSSENRTPSDGVFASAGAGLGRPGGRGGVGSRGGRSTVASKRLRLLLLHGNSSAASLLLQVRVRRDLSCLVLRVLVLVVLLLCAGVGAAVLGKVAFGCGIQRYADLWSTTAVDGA